MPPKSCLSHYFAAVEPMGVRISRQAGPSSPRAARPRRPTIFRAISLLAGAEIEPAIMRADALLEAGDLNGYAMWKRVSRAVAGLQGTEPGPEGRAS